MFKEFDKNKKTILIIDDDRNIIIALKYFLAINDFNVIAASNGDHALKLLKTHNPDLILLDIKMPKMNGYLFSQIIKTKEKLSKIPIIIISATPKMAGSIPISHQCDDFIQKPFDNERLLEKISLLLSKGDKK
jgi:DNA-binding response OmpR family regulator